MAAYWRAVGVYARHTARALTTPAERAKGRKVLAMARRGGLGIADVQTIGARTMQADGWPEPVLPANFDPISGRRNPERDVRDPLTGEWHTKATR